MLGDFAPNGAIDAEKSKAIVRRFLTETMQNRNLGALDTYVTAGVVQHDPALGQGVAGWRNWLVEHDVSYDFVFKVVGTGDYVATYSQALVDGVPYAYFDLFRLEGERIEPEAKHWHGAAHDSWFQHIALAVPAEGASADWLEPVTDEAYAQLRRHRERSLARARASRQKHAFRSKTRKNCPSGDELSPEGPNWMQLSPKGGLPATLLPATTAGQPVLATRTAARSRPR